MRLPSAELFLSLLRKPRWYRAGCIYKSELLGAPEAARQRPCPKPNQVLRTGTLVMQAGEVRAPWRRDDHHLPTAGDHRAERRAQEPPIQH